MRTSCGISIKMRVDDDETLGGTDQGNMASDAVHRGLCCFILKHLEKKKLEAMIVSSITKKVMHLVVILRQQDIFLLQRSKRREENTRCNGRLFKFVRGKLNKQKSTNLRGNESTK